MLTDSIILVAGTDLADRETIHQALGEQCHVVAAQTTEAALDHLSNSSPIDLVITELEATQLNGLELLRKWKRRQPHTPVLVITSGNDVSAAIEAMKSGAADCIVKPIDAAELRSVALKLVEGVDAEADAESDSNGNGSHGPKRKTNIDIPPGTSLEDLERAAVEQALAEHHGNRTHAAKTLGISVRTLQRKLKAWGMPMVAFHNPALNNNFVFAAHTPPPHMFDVHAP